MNLPQLADLSKVCLFLECQGFYISDSEEEMENKEFILRELGYSHWFLSQSQSGSLLYSNGMSYEKLTAHNKLDVKHRVRYVHGLPFEDAFFEDQGITLRDRNSVTRNIRDIYNNLFTDSRRIIAFKGYQTGQLLKNLSDIPLINLDAFDVRVFPGDIPELPFNARCQQHNWNLDCCRQTCVYYAHWMLSNKLTVCHDYSEDVTRRLANLDLTR